MSRPREETFDKFMDKVSPEPNTGCWLWFGATSSSGYGSLGVSGRMLSAHRVSWELANGPIPERLCVCHKCDVRCCVNPSHLFLGSHKENIADCISKGRRNSVCGESHGSSRLTEKDVLEIRASKEMQKDIAQKYGVSRTIICQIKSGKRWAHARLEIGLGELVSA